MPVPVSADPRRKLTKKKRDKKLGPLQIGASDQALLKAANDPERLQAMISQAKKLGVTNWRLLMEWGQVVKDGQLDFSEYDPVVDALRRNGISVRMAVLGTASYHPNWDQQLNFENPDPGKARYFARQVATHFNGRVAQYSAWNEPNYAAFGNIQPNDYRHLYQAMRDGFKSGDRYAEVGFGELAPTERADEWLHGALRGTKGVDFVSIHAYQDPALSPANFTSQPGTLGISALGYAHDIVRSTGVHTPKGRQPPIDITEIGYTAGTKNRAERLAQALKTADDYGARNVTLYQIFAPPRGTAPAVLSYDDYGNVTATADKPPGGGWDTSLVDPDGNPTVAYRAVQAAVHAIRKRHSAVRR